MIDLADIRRSLASAVTDAGADQLADLAGVLEVARVRLAQRLAAPCPTAAELVDAAEMAKRLGVTECWVATAGRAGTIPTVKLGHYRRFDPVAVIEAARAMKTPPPQDRQFCGVKKPEERRGGKRRVSNECPSSSAENSQGIA